MAPQRPNVMRAGYGVSAAAFPDSALPGFPVEQDN